MSNNNMIVIVPNPNHNEDGLWSSVGNWADKNKTTVLTTAVTAGAGWLLRKNPYIAIGVGVAVSGGQWAWNQWNSTDDKFFSEITEIESRKYQCQSGNFQQKVLYIKHPFRDIYYYSMADFHRKLFEEKHSELNNLLVALGATEITIQSGKGYSNSASVKSGDNNFAKFSTEAEKHHCSHINSHTKLPGHTKPYIPENLVWYENEDLWKSMAINRIKHGVSEASIHLTYTDDYGVNTNLKSKIDNINLSAGGHFSGHNKITLQIEVKFHPMQT